MTASDSSPFPSVAVFGLAVMGSNLARNIESRGGAVTIYNRTASVTEQFMNDFPGDRFIAAYSLDELLEKTVAPRQIILMIKAGAAVDAVVEELLPKLTKGDILIDGGNAYYRDTQRRVKSCAEQSVHFLGVGISGGEEGALRGPSIMPGGDRAAWEQVSPLLAQIAATYDGEPCTDYVGPDGAGHFVKMVHNGIEYADMQLIVEVYDLLKRGLGLTNKQIGKRFSQWNQGRLSSYLMEITAKIFQRDNDQGDGQLIDYILDKAGQKGTGQWTVQESLHLGVPIPTIAAAVDARGLSALRDERLRAAEHFGKNDSSPSTLMNTLGPTEEASDLLERALYAGKVVAYAQGMALIRQASKENEWNLALDRVASLWRAGCIIRASLLQEIMTAFREQPDLDNLVLFPAFTKSLTEDLPALRRIVAAGVQGGIPLPGLSSAVNYLEAYTSSRLPQNLIQAQRDFFGAHTYQRTDKAGTFHTDWEE